MLRLLDYLNVSKTLLKTQRYQLAILVLCLNDISWVSAELLDAPSISHGAAERRPPSLEMVTLDDRLAHAARREGFAMIDLTPVD